MQSKRKRTKVIQLVFVLISFVFFISDVWAELKLESVSPKIGVLGDDLNVTLTGTGFDETTRVTMALDSGNKKAIVGGVATGDSAHGIAISGSTAYVADGESGLQVIDISTPENPQVIGSLDTPGFAYSLALVGSTAYVADGVSGLQVIDVSNPDDPQKIGSENSPGEARDVSVADNVAYIADHSGGLRIIDVSNPADPNEIDSVDTPDIDGATTDAYGVTVVNSTAYVTYNYFDDSDRRFKGGLSLVDIDPESSEYLAIMGSVSTLGQAYGVTAVGDYAYVADVSEGLWVIDISTPAAPQVKGSTPTSYEAYDVTVVGETAYVADHLAGLTVIALTPAPDPDAPITAPTDPDPQIIGSVDTPGRTYGVSVVGDRAYLADGDGGLQVVDVNAPKIQQVIGWVDTPGLSLYFTVAGDYVYLADVSGDLPIIDISNPEDPFIETTAVIPGNPRGVAVVGNRAYVAATNRGLYILDITDPKNPQRLGGERTGGFAEKVTVEGDIAYVADGHNGLTLMDISTPESPQFIDSVNTPGHAYAVTILDNIAYVADREGGLRVIDVSNPDDPNEIGSVAPFSPEVEKCWANYFAVAGNRGYLAHGKCGLHVFDLSTPANPQLLGWVQTPDNAFYVTVEGNKAYVADGASGLQMIDVSDPTNPQIIGSVDTLGGAICAAIEGDKAYISDYQNGFLVAPLPVEVTPLTVNSSTTMSATLPSPSLPGDYILRVFNQSGESHELPGAVTFIEPEDAEQIFGQKAIIMAGDGKEETDPLTDSFRIIAEAAYDALVEQGYLADDIYYLTPDSANSKRDADATSANLFDAINTWAKDQDASELLLFITGHGLPGVFNPKPTDSFQVSDLKSWLDDLQNDTDARVIFIYDACNSGSFLIEMKPPTGKERISITSSTSIETATIARKGLDSFSYNFWFDILIEDGAKLANAFNFGKNSMEPFNQTAWLDADGNETPNEDTDDISTLVLRRGYTPGRNRPTIDQVSPEQSLQGETTATFWAKDITGPSDISSVRARIITPPLCNIVGTLPIDTAITNLPTVDLSDSDQDGTYTYEGSFDFSAAGAYQVAIYAIDEDGLESDSKDTFVYQSYGPDCYEDDDTYEQAKNIIIGDGTPQRHNFYNTGDEDWVKFYGIAGTGYVIEAKNLFPHADVVLEIYADKDTDPPKLLETQDSIGDPNANETLSWTCPQTGVFYVKVKPSSSDYTGEGTDYDLRVYEPTASIPGRIRGKITDSDSGKPIPTAQVTTDKKGAIVYPGGSYQMNHPAGTYKVTAKAKGYKEVVGDVSVEETGITTRNFALTPIDTSVDDGRAEIIGTWSSGIFYRDVAESKWTQMTTSDTTGDIAAGDFTGDGIADVASIWPNGLYYQDGDTLDWTKVPGKAPNRVTAGDVTGDGRAEIIGSWSNGIWYLDVAESKWKKMTPSVTDGDIAAGDFTGDGIADVASIWPNGLYYQDGDTLDWTKVPGKAPNRVTAGDVTGDGRAEIIGSWSNGIWYLDVAESKWKKMTPSVTDGDIAAGDFTGDGKADVASIWGNELYYQDGATLDWTKVPGTAPVSLTAGDVTGQ